MEKSSFQSGRFCGPTLPHRLRLAEMVKAAQAFAAVFHGVILVRSTAVFSRAQHWGVQRGHPPLARLDKNAQHLYTTVVPKYM